MNTFTVQWLIGGLLASTLASEAQASSTGLENLRAEVDHLAAPYLVKDAMLRVKVSQRVFTHVTDAISSLPPPQRRVSFDGDSAVGYVWNQGGGFLGCGGYAEINSGGRDFHFTADASALHTEWQPDGRMLVKINVAANAWSTIHGHIRGPAGMCSGPSFTYPLGRWSCDCPIGGGAGSVVGVHADKGSNFEGYMTVTPQSGGELGYALFLTSPSSISVTVSAGLQGIGDIGIPVSFTLPTTPLLQGTIASVIASRGQVTIGAARRPYELSLINLRIHPDASGLEMLADASLSGRTKVARE